MPLIPREVPADIFQDIVTQEPISRTSCKQPAWTSLPRSLVLIPRATMVGAFLILRVAS